MQICRSIESIKSLRENLDGTIGFIPTMGALHDGHLSLVTASKKSCGYTIVSIFVNPMQFNSRNDLISYPRLQEKDMEMLKKLAVDSVFIPSHKHIYPEGFSTEVDEKSLSGGLEGRSRPGHFTGVATVLAKFFNIIQPTHAFFGEKDAQQLRVVKQMVHDLNFNLDIISCPTVREKSGLALSSRNENLSTASREKAAVIYNGLKLGENALENGERYPKKIKEIIYLNIIKEPLAEIIYISVADSESLEEVEGRIEKDILVSLAVNFDGARLIDNFTYSLSGT